MKRLSFLALLMAASCAAPQQPQLLLESDFEGEVDGKKVELVTLKAGDIILQATNFGGRVASIFTPDKDGKLCDIVVGHSCLKDYVTPSGERFLGACVGPVANRIGGAKFTLDGVEYHTPANNNEVNTLHGGYIGFDNVVWDILEKTDTSVVLHYLKPDGLEGYPGNLDVTMTYSVTSKDEFRIDYRATTDAATPVNIANHPFFCLRGESGGSVEDYQMYIKADSFIPIDSLSIPTGEIAPVEGTPFDFREVHTLGERIGADDIQLHNAKGYDHNWCIAKETEGVELVCSVKDPVSGRKVDVLTDQPGIQVYSGNFFDGLSCGKYGRPLGFRSSIALETQKWPDSINQPNFTDTVLRPGEVYTQTCIYKFSAE